MIASQFRWSPPVKPLNRHPSPPQRPPFHRSPRQCGARGWAPGRSIPHPPNRHLSPPQLPSSQPSPPKAGTQGGARQMTKPPTRLPDPPPTNLDTKKIPKSDESQFRQRLGNHSSPTDATPLLDPPTPCTMNLQVIEHVCADNQTQLGAGTPKQPMPYRHIGARKCPNYHLSSHRENPPGQAE